MFKAGKQVKGMMAIVMLAQRVQQISKGDLAVRMARIIKYSTFPVFPTWIPANNQTGLTRFLTLITFLMMLYHNGLLTESCIQ